MLAEKGLPPQELQPQPLTLDKLKPQNLFDYVQVKITLPKEPVANPKKNQPDPSKQIDKAIIGKKDTRQPKRVGIEPVPNNPVAKATSVTHMGDRPE